MLGVRICELAAIVLSAVLTTAGGHAQPDWVTNPPVGDFLLQGDEIPPGAAAEPVEVGQPTHHWFDPTPGEAQAEEIWAVRIRQVFRNPADPTQQFSVGVNVFEKPEYARWRWYATTVDPTEIRDAYRENRPLEEREGYWVIGRVWVASSGAFRTFGEAYMQRLLAKLGASEAPPQARRPCKEAEFYYGADVLDGYYTDQPSLTYTREELVAQMVDALRAYEAEGRILSFGVNLLDSVEIASAFASGHIETGFEEALRRSVEEARAAAPGALITPGQLFLHSLRACSGNVRTALVTCHSILYRDGAERNSAWIGAHLQRLRNPAGYSDTHPISTQGRTSNPRTEVGDDEQGVWYHLYGMAALEFTDRHNLTPLVAFRLGSALLLDSSYRDGTRWLFPVSDAAGHLSAYALELENAQRAYQRKPPDPDKVCIGFTGAAAGRALSDYMREYDPPTVEIPVRDWDGNVHTEQFTLRQASPLSVRIEGAEGEEFRFDQVTRTFGGNTAQVLVEPFPEEDGTWGLVLTPLFRPTRVTWTATSDGEVSVAYYAYASARCEVYEIDVRRGDELVLTDWATDASLTHDGSVLSPRNGDAVAVQPHEEWGGVFESPASSQPGPSDLAPDAAIAFLCTFDAPGTLLDTVGINAAETGDFTVAVTGDNRLRFQLFDPTCASAGAVGNGWHAVESGPLEPSVTYSVVVAWGRDGLQLAVEGDVWELPELMTPCRGPVYFGDYPGDVIWEPQHDTRKGFVGSLRSVLVLAGE